MNLKRSSGLLLHPTSLPGRFGVGDLGAESYRFADFLAASGQTFWQVMPLGPTGYGDSPYQCFSAFAGNTLLVSPERLVESGLLSDGDVADAPEFDAGRVEYGRVIDFKRALLEKAYGNFKRKPNAKLRGDYEGFLQYAAAWLDDYALNYLNSDGAEVHWDFIRASLSSVSAAAIVPVQDLLGLGSEARMNTPASAEGNWAWRLREGALTDKLRDRLRQMTELYARAPWQ